MQWKKALTVLVAALAMSGCAALKSGLQTKILEESGLADDPDYQRYMTLLDQELLDETGIYLETETAAGPDTESEGRIHVTFAQNPRVRARFYLDAEKTVPVTECDLNPGDQIYIDTPVASHPATDLFSAGSFRLVSYDSEYNEVYSEIIEAEGDGSRITIPENCPWPQLSVQPLGNYDSRVVYLSDYILDEEGRRHEQAGEWIVNETVFTETSADIPSSMDLDPAYQYDPGVYRFISSDPEAYLLDEKTGVIRFAHEDALSELNRYEIELQKYLNVHLSGSPAEGLVSASVNGAPAWIEENTVRKILREDRLSILVNEGYKVTSKDLAAKGEPEKTEEGYLYSFDVPQDAEADPCILIREDTDYWQPLSIWHAELSLIRSDGNEAEEGEAIDPAETVRLRLIPEEGYYISGSDIENNMLEKEMTFEEYLGSVDDIINSHKISRFISVTLADTGEHGTCEYSLNKEPVSETVSGLKAGDRIKVKYTLTDKNWKFDSGSDDVLSNLIELVQSVFSRSSRTVYIRVNAEMDGETLNGEDYTVIRKRGS